MSLNMAEFLGKQGMAEWQWGERVRLERFATIEGWPWVGFNMKRSSSAVVGAHLCPEHLE